MQRRHAKARHDRSLALRGDEFSARAATVGERMIDEAQAEEHLGHFQHFLDRCFLRVQHLGVVRFRADLAVQRALPSVFVDDFALVDDRCRKK